VASVGVGVGRVRNPMPEYRVGLLYNNLMRMYGAGGVFLGGMRSCAWVRVGREEG